MLVDGREAAARASPAAEAGLLGTSMSSPEEELAAVLHRTGCGREVVSFSAINKMFQRQARRLDTQRQQQEQNRQAIEQAMESMQADLEVQKLQANRQVRFPPFCRAVPNSDGHAHAGGRRSG
jgi:chromatin segregation and condensation protein Rec8/ScpA/Scc1 (kleisin family)